MFYHQAFPLLVGFYDYKVFTMGFGDSEEFDRHLMSIFLPCKVVGGYLYSVISLLFLIFSYTVLCAVLRRVAICGRRNDCGAVVAGTLYAFPVAERQLWKYGG